MVAKVQIKRTATPNAPPTGLLPGELSIEMANPTRLWVGVPMTLDPSGKKLLYDSSAAAPIGDYVQRSGDTMTGPLTLYGNPTANLMAVTKQYCDGNRGMTKPEADTYYVKIPGDTMTGELINLVNVKSAHFTVRGAATGPNQNAQLRGNNADDTVRGILFWSIDGSVGLTWKNHTYGVTWRNDGVMDLPLEGWRISTTNMRGYVDASNNTLQMSDGTAWQHSRGDGHLYLRYYGSNNAIFYNNGNHYVSGAWVAKPGGGPWADSSDARIKNVTGEYTTGLEAILALKPITYTFKGNDFLPNQKPTRLKKAGAKPGDPEGEIVYPAKSLHHDVAQSGKEFVGLVAQDVEGVMPEMVGLTTGMISGLKVEDLRTLDTGPLIFALVNAVKTLAARVETLEAQLAQPKGPNP